MSVNTRRQYLREFLRFLRRFNLDPERLYELRLQHLKSDDPRDRRIIEGWVRQMMVEERERGKKPSSVYMIYKAVRSFFQAQNLEFSLRSREKPRVYHEGQRVLTRDQIREMYDRVGEQNRLRNRALIMLLKDSGLRVSDVANLKVSDYLEAKTVYNDAGEPFKVFYPFETEKTGSYAYIHIGPEAIKAIDEYLEERRREEGELDADPPLFINRWGERLSPAAISATLWKIAAKIGERKISAHSLRKFHQTMLEAAGMPKNWIAKLQGKTIGDTSAPYSRPEEMLSSHHMTLLTEAYLKAYDNLRVFTYPREEMERLRRRIRELESELASRDRLIEKMEERFERLVRSLMERIELLEVEIRQKPSSHPTENTQLESY